MANKYTSFVPVTETHKQCISCHEMKTFDNFHKDKRNVYAKGLAYYCKSCATKKSRAWYANNKSNPDFKRKKRNSWIEISHGISLAEYEERLSKQRSKCAICDIDLVAEGHLCHLDHDHKTGKLRSFLCTNCNRGLGHFKENIYIYIGESN